MPQQDLMLFYSKQISFIFEVKKVWKQIKIRNLKVEIQVTNNI